jgi:hypothetical protein
LASEKYTLPAPANSDEQEFQIGDELTVFEAAMIYAGRHPAPRFLKDGTIHDHLDFLRAGIREREPRSRIRIRARRSWDIYCEIIARIKAGRIQPLRPAYDAEGQVDPIRTVIRTPDLQDLAKERRERPRALTHLQTAQSSPRKSGTRPAFERAKRALGSIYSNGVPDQIAEPNKILVGRVGAWLEEKTMRAVGKDTILRAAGRRK